MKDVYAVLRQKELEQSRLKNEVEALKVVAPLLDGGNTELDHPLTLKGAARTPQPSTSGQQVSTKQHWP